MKETKIAQSAVRVRTGHFESSWGHKPRGAGLWWFEPDRSGGVQFTHRGPYSKAKREAIKWAAEHGFRTIEVLP